MTDLKDDGPVKAASTVGQQTSVALPEVERSSLQRDIATVQVPEKSTGQGSIIETPAGASSQGKLNPFAALLTLQPAAQKVVTGMQRHILELQEALRNFASTRSTPDKRQSIGEEGGAITLQGLESVSAAVDGSDVSEPAPQGGHRLGNVVDPVRQIAVPEWCGTLLSSSIPIDQEVALAVLAQHVVHAGLTREERQHPEQALRSAEACLARLKIQDLHIREKALKAIRLELDRRRSDAFAEEVRSESEARASVDRILEHSFFSVEDSLPGLELYVHTKVVPAELHTPYTDSAEMTLSLICEEALARAAAGEEIPVRFLVSYADVTLQQAPGTDQSIDLSDALLRLEHQYKEGLYKLYTERFPLEELHRVDLSLSTSKNSEEAFAKLAEIVPGGDRQLFGSYAISTITRVAAHQNHDLGLLVAEAWKFGVPLCGRSSSLLEMKIPDGLRNQLNEERVLEHARTYSGQTDPAQLFVPQTLISERLQLLAQSSRPDADARISKIFDIQGQKEESQSEAQRPLHRLKGGRVRLQSDLVTSQDVSDKPLASSEEIPLRIQGLEVVTDQRLKAPGGEIFSFRPQEGVSTWASSREAFLSQQLGQFVEDKKDASLREYTASLMSSVEWVQFEFAPVAEQTVVNPFVSPDGRLEPLGLPTRSKPLQLLAPGELSISRRSSLNNQQLSGERMEPTPITRGYAALALDVFEQRIQAEVSRSLATRDVFKLEETLQIVAEVEPHLRSIAGQGQSATPLYQQLMKRIQGELAKDAAALPSAELPVYRALGFGFKNELCKPQDVVSSLRHLSQLRELPVVLQAVAQHGSPIQELRTVHDTPASLTSIEAARASRLEALCREVGTVAGRKKFVVETSSRLESHTELGNVELSPVDSPRLVITADISVGELCKSIFRTREPMQGDLYVLASIDPQLAAGVLDGTVKPSSIVPAGTIVKVAGTPLGFEIQQAAAADRVRKLSEELRVCRDPEAKPEIEHCLRVSEVFASFVQREGNMLALQRNIDQIALEIEDASVVARGNAERLRSVVEEDLPRCRDALMAERKRSAEVEVKLSALVKRLETESVASSTEIAQELELARNELDAVKRHRAALSGREAQPEEQRSVCRSPATALAEVALLAEQQTQEYAEIVLNELPGAESDTGAKPVVGQEKRAEEARWLRLEKHKAASAAQHASSAVPDLLLSLADVSSGTHSADADLMLRSASLVLVSAAERELAQGGLTNERLQSASDKFFAAAQALSRGTNLPGINASKKLELQKAIGEMYAKAYEYRAAVTQDASRAAQDLGRALSWIVTDGDSEARAFSFVDASNTKSIYLDSSGADSSWGIFTTEIAALQSIEVDRLATRIASLPESRRARALELLSQVVDRHSSHYEMMARDGAFAHSRDAAYRALQVARDVPYRAVRVQPELIKVKERIRQQVQRGELTEAQAGEALLKEQALAASRSEKTTYDSECSLLARGMRARFLLAFNDASDTEGQIDAELEAIRAEIRNPHGAQGRTVAHVSAELEAERARSGEQVNGSRVESLERELIEAQVREARKETLVTRMDALALSSFTQLAANTSSGNREKFAERVVRVVDEAMVRDEDYLRTQRELIMQAAGPSDVQKGEVLEAARKGMRARHADLLLATIQAYSAAGRFDLAQKKLEQLESGFAGEMSTSTAKVVEDIHERHSKGEPLSAAFTAALNEAQTGGSLTQSLGFAGAGAATGAAVGVWFFGVGAPVGALIGGVVGLVADKSTNVIRGRSRIGAAFESGISGIEGWQSGVNALTLGVDIVTVWLPLRGAGRVVSKVGFGGLARGTLNAEARAAFSGQLTRMLTEAGVTSTRELGEKGVRQVASHMMRQELLRGMGQHGGKLLAAQAGTAGGMYGYNRFSIEFNESLTDEQKSVAIKQLNQEALTHGGMFLAMVGVGALLGRSSNRAWSNKAESMLGVRKLSGQEQAAARAVIQRWGANVRSAAVGSTGPVAVDVAVKQESAVPARQATSADAPPAGSGKVAENPLVSEKKIFGQDAAKALAELAKDPALQNSRAKEVLNRLYNRFDRRGASLQDCYLLESELNAARAGRLAANPDIPPSGDTSSGGGGGGNGGNDKGPSRPSGGGDEGGAGSDYSEWQPSHEEFQFYSDDFRELIGRGGARSGVIENSLGGSRSRTGGGGAAVIDRPSGGNSRVSRPPLRPGGSTGDVVSPGTRPAASATKPLQQRTPSLDSSLPETKVQSVARLEIQPRVQPEIELSPVRLSRQATPGLTTAVPEIAIPSVPVEPLTTSIPELAAEEASVIGRAAPAEMTLSPLELSDSVLPETKVQSAGRLKMQPRVQPEIELPPVRLSRQVTPGLTTAVPEIAIPAAPVESLTTSIPELAAEEASVIGRAAPAEMTLSPLELSDTVLPELKVQSAGRLEMQARIEPEIDPPPVRLSRQAAPSLTTAVPEISIPSMPIESLTDSLPELAAEEASVISRAAPAEMTLSPLELSDPVLPEVKVQSVARLEMQARVQAGIELPPVRLSRQASPSLTTAVPEIAIPPVSVESVTDSIPELVVEEASVVRRAAPAEMTLLPLEPSDPVLPETKVQSFARLEMQPRVQLEVELPPVRLSRQSPPSLTTAVPEIAIPPVSVESVADSIPELAAEDAPVVRRAAPAEMTLLPLEPSAPVLPETKVQSFARLEMQPRVQPEIELPPVRLSRQAAPSLTTAVPEIAIPPVSVESLADSIPELAAEEASVVRRAAPTEMTRSPLELSDPVLPETTLQSTRRLEIQPRVRPEIELPPVRLTRQSQPSLTTSVPDIAISSVSEERAPVLRPDLLGAELPPVRMRPAPLKDISSQDLSEMLVPRRAAAPAETATYSSVESPHLQNVPERIVQIPRTSPSPRIVSLPVEIPVRSRPPLEEPTPIEIPRVLPKPEISPTILPTTKTQPQRAPVEEGEAGLEPFSALLPGARPTFRPKSDADVQRAPQPVPEPESSKSALAQATEEQTKKKRELELGGGSDLKREESRRKAEECRIRAEGVEERKKKKDKRRSGRRVGKRIVAGEIGCLVVEEDQQTQYDKNQFTSSRLRSSEGRED